MFIDIAPNARGMRVARAARTRAEAKGAIRLIAGSASAMLCPRAGVQSTIASLAKVDPCRRGGPFAEGRACSPLRAAPFRTRNRPPPLPPLPPVRSGDPIRGNSRNSRNNSQPILRQCVVSTENKNVQLKPGRNCRLKNATCSLPATCSSRGTEDLKGILGYSSIKKIYPPGPAGVWPPSHNRGYLGNRS
jgi:hypothetical protein